MKLENYVKLHNMGSDTRLTTSKIQILRSKSSLSSMGAVPGPCPRVSTYHRVGEDSCLSPNVCTRVVGEDFAHEAPYYIDGVLKGDSLETSL